MSELPDPLRCAKRVLELARAWCTSRARLRRIGDSKSAKSSDVVKAQRKHMDDTAKLEAAILQLEASLRTYKGKNMKPKKAFPLKELLTVLGKGASALSEAMGHGGQSVQKRDIMEVEGEVIE